MKKTIVNISICLSSEQEIRVPDNFEYDPAVLENYVLEQVKLPNEKDWYIDEFCVV